MLRYLEVVQTSSKRLVFCPLCPLPPQITFYDPVRSSFELSSRLTCPGTMGPPQCLAELQREAGAPPGLLWGDTGAGLVGRWRRLGSCSSPEGAWRPSCTCRPTRPDYFMLLLSLSPATLTCRGRGHAAEVRAAAAAQRAPAGGTQGLRGGWGITCASQDILSRDCALSTCASVCVYCYQLSDILSSPCKQVLHSGHSDWVTRVEHIPGGKLPASCAAREPGGAARAQVLGPANTLPSHRTDVLVSSSLDSNAMLGLLCLLRHLAFPSCFTDVGLVSSSLDATLAMLDLERRKLVASVGLHRKPVRTFGYSPAFSLVARWVAGGRGLGITATDRAQ